MKTLDQWTDDELEKARNLKLEEARQIDLDPVLFPAVLEEVAAIRAEQHKRAAVAENPHAGRE